MILIDSARLRQIGYAALAGLLICNPAGATAETPPEQLEKSDASWTFTAAPYLWATGIDGQVGLLGFPPQPVNLDFGDVLENLDGGFMGVAEARRGRFSVGVDLTYANIGQTVDTPIGFATNTIDATVKTSMITAVAGYDVAPSDDISVDLVGGARYWSVKNKFNFLGGALDGTSVSENADWFDPVVGLKFHSRVSERLDLAGWALLGGMGAGSDEMWDIMAGPSYRVGKRTHIFAGYRAVGVDYSKDGFVYDVIQRGPVFGGVFQF